ncbi:MAG: dephospho-CoA kinase [FCB group bacterium]|nr:dephospho-CoA kinase [FCB group bacterium]
MKSIAVTGGLGSGKSAVLNIFYQLGANTLSADDIAKHLLQVNPELRKSIKETFGEACYLDDELQAHILAKQAFATPEKQKTLNALIHPLLKTYLHKYISATKVVPGILMVEAAILLEAGFEDLFDRVLLITADKDVRIRRAVRAGYLTEEDIIRRISLQMPEEEKRSRADNVIENNGSEAELFAACSDFWQMINND